MPNWITRDEIIDFVDCTEEELYALTDMEMNRELTAKEKSVAQERFTMIAGVLPFLTNERERSYRIDKLAGEKSKQILRQYLCLYLTYQDISVLAPAKRKEMALSADEKNFRWALNKFRDFLCIQKGYPIFLDWITFRDGVYVNCVNQINIIQSVFYNT